MHSGQPQLQMESMQPEGQEDSTICAAIKQYMAGLVPQLNFRLLCDMEAGAYGFPGEILWVENITVYQIEEKAAVCGDIENDCQAEELPAERKEPAGEELEEKSFAGRMRYKLEQFKNNWKSLWKKKGR